MFPYQNTSTNFASISFNRESHQMICLHPTNHFIKLLLLLVVQNQYCFRPETCFYAKRLNFLPDLFHYHFFSLGSIAAFARFGTKWIISNFVILFNAMCTYFYFHNFILIIRFKKCCYVQVWERTSNFYLHSYIRMKETKSSLKLI